jgi:hypothetical protein
MSDLSLLHQQLAHWNTHAEITVRDCREHVVSENPYCGEVTIQVVET